MVNSELSEPTGDPLGQLERAFIEEFLLGRGYHLNTLRALPADQATALMREASAYASGRLTEVETRAHLVEDLHDASEPIGRRNGRRAG
jgi:hypothetical protein